MGDEPLSAFAPENDLEQAVVAHPELRAGLAWGRPRRGHPEGSVGAHVTDLLRRIDRAEESGERRRMLRFIVLVHDSFKYQVQTFRPRTGENHHGMRARRFAERFTNDERLLSTIELHDRPYTLWRRLRRTGRLDEPVLPDLLERIPDLDLFLRFLELDTSTEGKSQEPLRWFREELRRVQNPAA